MSLRLKIVAAMAALAVLATVALGFTSYRTTRVQLLRAVDQSLDAALRDGLLEATENESRPPRRRLGREIQIEAQLLAADGTVLSNSGVDLPVDRGDIEIAGSASIGSRDVRTVLVDGVQLRMLTAGLARGGAIQVSRGLGETNSALRRIAERTMWAVLAVAGLAVLAGWWLGRHVTRRLNRLTRAAGQVASTGALDLEIPVDGRDEVAELGVSFRRMLEALHESKTAQHQLVQDAGHELRTPLTSLRTNISVLRRYDELPGEARRQILDDLDSEARELTLLVNEIVELATERRDDEAAQVTDLAEIAERVAATARRRSGREVIVRADTSLVMVRRSAVERAVHNLVDNAIKFAASGPIEIDVHAGTISVRDHGPGLPVGEERRIFERFYRTVAARSLAGSGLGLSIVQSVADAHGATTFATNAPGGGALIGIRFVLVPPNDEQPSPFAAD